MKKICYNLILTILIFWCSVMTYAKNSYEKIRILIPKGALLFYSDFYNGEKLLDVFGTFKRLETLQNLQNPLIESGMQVMVSGTLRDTGSIIHNCKIYKMQLQTEELENPRAHFGFVGNVLFYNSSVKTNTSNNTMKFPFRREITAASCPDYKTIPEADFVFLPPPKDMPPRIEATHDMEGYIMGTLKE